MGKKGGGTKQVSTIPKWMERAAKPATNWGRELTKAPYQTYGGQRISGFSPDQNRAMNLTRMQATPGYQMHGRNQVRKSIRNVDTDQWSAKQRDQYMSPYMDSVADTTAADMERARQVQQRSTGDQAASAGAFGGSRHGVAEAETNRNFYDRLGKTMGGLRQDAYGQAASMFSSDQSRQLRADMANQNADMQSYNLWDSMYQNQVDATTRLANQGDAQQRLRQRIVDTDYNDWAKLNDEPMRRVERYTGILGGMPGRQQSVKEGPSDMQQGLGTALQVAGTAALFMSDRRVKRDVERVGTTPEGLGLYAYRYLWSDTPEIGVMADEVRAAIPEAVTTGPLTGLDMVDYSKLEARA